MSGLRQPGNQPEAITVTASTLTITPHDAGKVFHNLGNAGNIAYTVQTAANFRPGDQITILSADDGTTTVNFTAGQLIAFNNVAATAVALSTSNEIIGGGFIFTCLSAAKWHMLALCEETQTITVS
jgi:hypothetical protein